MTKELKDFHQTDFKKLLESSNTLSEIEDSIKKPLLKINGNSIIHSLYSKDGLNDTNRVRKSYITFCYFKYIEEKIFKEILPKILTPFNQGKNHCIYKFSYPRDNEMYRKENNTGFSYKDNPDHFRINHIRIELKSMNKDTHKLFWSELTENFIKIK